MSPSTPQWKMNGRNRKSSHYFSAVSNVISLRHCSMTVRECWPSASLKNDPDQHSLVKQSCRLKNLEARKKSQNTPDISEIP